MITFFLSSDPAATLSIYLQQICFFPKILFYIFVCFFQTPSRKSISPFPFLVGRNGQQANWLLQSQIGKQSILGTYLVNKYEITSSYDLNFRVCFNSSSLQKSSSVIHTLLFFTAFLSNKSFSLRKRFFICVFTSIIVKIISLSQVFSQVFTQVLQDRLIHLHFYYLHDTVV